MRAVQPGIYTVSTVPWSSEMYFISVEDSLIVISNGRR